LEISPRICQNDAMGKGGEESEQHDKASSESGYGGNKKGKKENANKTFAAIV